MIAYLQKIAAESSKLLSKVNEETLVTAEQAFQQQSKKIYAVTMNANLKLNQELSEKIVMLDRMESHNIALSKHIQLLEGALSEKNSETDAIKKTNHQTVAENKELKLRVETAEAKQQELEILLSSNSQESIKQKSVFEKLERFVEGEVRHLESRGIAFHNVESNHAAKVDFIFKTYRSLLEEEG